MAKKIYINPGHSEKDPGAVGYETERRLNVAVSRHMNDYLLANYACETKVNSGDSLYALADEANAWGADLFVSNHFNAAGGDGYECYVYSDKTLPLGKLFEKQVLRVGQNSRGVKIRTNLAVLYRTAMPAILNEGAFVDNKKDIEDWNEEQELKVLGIAYAKAAAEYLSLPEKQESQPSAQTGICLRTLKKGDKGEDVRALQILLAGNGCKGKMFEAGYGSFGGTTEEAVKLYQKKVGLPQTGIADQILWQALLGVNTL